MPPNAVSDNKRSSEKPGEREGYYKNHTPHSGPSLDIYVAERDLWHPRLAHRNDGTELDAEDSHVVMSYCPSRRGPFPSARRCL